MISMRDITKAFENGNQKVNVIKGISLDIHEGDLISIMGPSGSGKSTFLHIMGCLDNPSSGVYQIDGKDVTALSDQKMAYYRNRYFGFVHQNFALIEDESVLENVSIPLLFSDVPLKNVDRTAMEMLDRFQMLNYIDKKVCTLSGGEKQRIAIARALVNQPDIILADEPTGALDEENTQHIMEYFLQLNKEGKTIVIITHDSDVASQCRRQYKMSDGKLHEIA